MSTRLLVSFVFNRASSAFANASWVVRKTLARTLRII
jgi:hypothetical protein